MELEVDSEVYYKYVMKEYKKNRAPKEFMTKQWVDIMIERIKAAEIIMAKEGYESLHRNVKAAMRTYSITKKKKTVKLLQNALPGGTKRTAIVTLEESYNVIKKAHLATKHGSPEEMETWLVDHYYKVHKICSEVYQNLCRKCHDLRSNNDENGEDVIAQIAQNIVDNFRTPEEPITENESETENLNNNEDVFTKVFHEEKSYQTACSIDILDFSDSPDNSYKFLMVHQDRRTKYVQLRPMESTSETELSIELIKLMADFSPPECMVVDAYNETIIQVICEKIKALTGTDIALVLHYSENKLVKHVTEKIIEWMKTNDCINWGTGCHIVQWNMNNELDSDGNTPFSKLFGYKYNGPRNKSRLERENDKSEQDNDNSLYADFVIELNDIKHSIEEGIDNKTSDIDPTQIVKTENFLHELEILANGPLLQELGNLKVEPDEA